MNNLVKLGLIDKNMPDSEKMPGNIPWIDAYGAYLRKEVNISRDASIIVGADSLVAILAGLAVFPIIFANNIEPSSGPGLVFQALPIAFSQTAGGLIFGALFFILLFFAALTSSIAMIEAPVSWLSDETNLSRRMAAVLVRQCLLIHPDSSILRSINRVLKTQE